MPKDYEEHWREAFGIQRENCEITRGKVDWKGNSLKKSLKDN